MQDVIKLSARQQQILDYIKDNLRLNGYPPSVREIGAAVGLSSSSTVHNHLSKLEALGLLKRDPTKPRAIDLADRQDIWQSESVIAVPLVGKVTAGQPILAIENIEETYAMPKALLGHDSNRIFMLEVKGDSMINAGIFNGDFVLVREQSTAQNGDIVVALLDSEEATVKRFYKEKEAVRLQPENDAMEPIFTRNVEILGKVVSLYRNI